MSLLANIKSFSRTPELTIAYMNATVCLLGVCCLYHNTALKSIYAQVINMHMMKPLFSGKI